MRWCGIQTATSGATRSGNLPNGANGSVNKIWAAPDPTVAGQIDAWAVGTIGNKATVWYSTDSDTAASPTWIQQLSVASPATFTDVSGFQTGAAFQIFAVGSSGTGVYASPDSGTTWTSTQLGAGTGGHPATAVNGVFALDATHAWAVGVSGGIGTVWAFNATTWDGGTQISTTTTLTNVRASTPRMSGSSGRALATLPSLFSTMEPPGQGRRLSREPRA